MFRHLLPEEMSVESSALTTRTSDGGRDSDENEAATERVFLRQREMTLLSALRLRSSVLFDTGMGSFFAAAPFCLAAAVVSTWQLAGSGGRPSRR